MRYATIDELVASLSPLERRAVLDRIRVARLEGEGLYEPPWPRASDLRVALLELDLAEDALKGG